MNSKSLKSIRLGSALLGALALTMVGCGGPPPSDSSVATIPVKKVTYTPQSEAGLPVTQDTDSGQLKKLYLASASKYGSVRKDPFALTSDESAFESNQSGARAFSELGWQVDYTPTQEEDVVPTLEEQPYRRLAGVVVGDSVLAIIEMGDGSEPQIVRPGQKIPNTEWTVVSIDEEKAVLHRDGNTLPHDVTVRLETPKPGTPGYNAGTTNIPTGQFPGQRGNGNGAAPGGGNKYGRPGAGGG